MSSHDWTRCIEHIVLSTMGGASRIVGIAGVRRKSGVSLLCHSLARTLAASELATLRIDLDPPPPEGPAAAGEPWQPGRTKARPWIATTQSGYDLLEVRTSAQSRPLFANVARLREVFAEEFGDYQRIIVELPPIVELTPEAPNPAAVAAVCDTMLLVTVIGRDVGPELMQAVDSLRGVGVTVSGVIVNDVDQSQTRREVRQARSMFGFRLNDLVRRGRSALARPAPKPEQRPPA